MMKSQSEAKVMRKSFQKNVKCYDFIHNFIVKFMYEDDVSSTWFSSWYYLALAFQMKKEFKFQKFCPCGFWLPQIVNKILRFCSWYRLWHLTDFCLNNNIYSTHIFLEITTFISIWFHLSHNGCSKLIKIFIKSFFLAF